MNEQIRQLLEQAKTESSQWLGSKPATTITYDELYKFAELIVQECTSICAKQAWESRTNDDWTEYNALSRVAGQIKQHFGVEE